MEFTIGILQATNAIYAWVPLKTRKKNDLVPHI